MKYIRTKDAYGNEIIALFDDRPIEKGGNVLKFSKKSIVLRKGIVINRKDFDNSNQADTIEELCDLYVIWLKNRELPLFERTQKGRRLYPSYFEVGECSFDKGYGAIWTDKGLIYVAKMNSKGELELL